MIVTTQPSAKDPRFAARPQDAGKRPAPTHVLRCSRGAEACGSQIPVTLRGPTAEDQARDATLVPWTPEELAARVSKFATDLGWQLGQVEHTRGKLFCSRACRDIAERSGAGDKARPNCSKPLCVRDFSSNNHGVCYCRPQHPLPSKPVEITRVTVRDHLDNQGKARRAFVCDRWACPTARYVDPLTPNEKVAKLAAAEGWVQTEVGTVCGAECAKKIRAEVLRGEQDPVEAGPAADQEARRLKDSSVRKAPPPFDANADGSRTTALPFEWRDSGREPDGYVYTVDTRRDPNLGTWVAACLEIKGLVVRGYPTDEQARAACRKKALQVISYRIANSEQRGVVGQVRFRDYAAEPPAAPPPELPAPDPPARVARRVRGANAA